MSKLKDSIMKSEEKFLERAFRLMEYKYLATKYKQDMKHRAVGGVDVGMVAQMTYEDFTNKLIQPNSGSGAFNVGVNRANGRARRLVKIMLEQFEHRHCAICKYFVENNQPTKDGYCR